ncbi:DEAD/DEAH box helicase [Nocardia cyriacigeorgica]|uniref:Putative helicase n=1 Tax=Nocardia cyriacigeorgica (strain GUH-2) TaxID=1127134 RepID=H6R330_NOCCG|nr:DEAD/DEAH box helicase [Nocardia cyriacigeorgica]MBF6423684.1 DEAD/DEAH box helicase [Nocardia cyriacigeorgica]CCF64429.1 putative helicase [Nocardia cyriacigeorgica GUH-2]
MFAVWTWTGHGPGRPPRDLGVPAVQALAVPTGTAAQAAAGSATIEVADVDCTLLEPGEFAAADLPEPDASVAAWRRALADDMSSDIPLPLAAHALPNATGTAIVSAHFARTACTASRAVANELRDTLKADLRPYQSRGVSWLRAAVAEHGGAVLADEMGLGKTVQTIGFLLGRADGPQLVVCPTSLVGNWVHEIQRFAPGLHPVAWRGGAVEAEAGTVVVAGYPTLRLHGAALREIRWATAVFDEAQALKNPRTQVSKAARSLDAAATVALTGTPVENHLDELWAVLNLVAPRLFGHRTQFRRRFARPIQEGSANAAARLREAIEPVLLARRKDQVAASLPAKIHTDLLCDLAAEQERLYDQLLDRAIDDGFGHGAQRQSRVLAALTGLKQVCNHPGLITGELDELAGRSGKLDLCTDIVANNLDLGAPTLVFTQYRKTGELLVRHFAEQFGVSAPFFHGGLNQAERARIVSEFQAADGPPVLILSLRAAGTGLTLTRAADVIHFDRWWNPAVEAQASDRAHRIGQTRTVTVTTLTSGTTVEEHIAAMQRRKSALTDLGDAAGIAELARLDDDQLIEILRRKREN